MRKNKHYTASQLLLFKRIRLMREFIERVKSGEFDKDFFSVVEVKVEDSSLIRFDVVFKTPLELVELTEDT